MHRKIFLSFLGILNIFLMLTPVMAKPLHISSFEIDADLKKWKVSSSASSFKRVLEHATDGSFSGCFTIQAWQPPATEWPTIYITKDSGLPTDWSAYDSLSFDYYNPGDSDPELRIKITDRSGKSLNPTVIMPPGAGSIVYPLDGLDKENIVDLRFYLTRPSKPTVIYFDNIKIIDTIPPKAPESIKASRIDYWGNVRIDWDEPGGAVDGDLPAWYRIYRGSISPVQLQAPIAIFPAGTTTWIDENASIDQRFFYVVTAMDDDGNESKESKEFIAEKVGVLTSFEGANEAGSWEKSGTGTYLTRGSTRATEGTYSGKFSVIKYQTGGQQWPGIRWRVTGGLPSDWFSFDKISIDYYNPGTSGVPLSVRIDDTVGGSYQKTHTLAVGSGTLTIALADLNIDISKISFLNLYYTRPAEAYVLYLDNIRLVDSIPPNEPTDLIAKRVNGTSKVRVTWQLPMKAIDNDLPLKYRVYRGESSNFIPGAPLVEISAHETTWIDTNSVIDKPCYYVVTAIDKMGNESELSQEAFVNPTGSIKGSVTTDGSPAAGALVSINSTDIVSETNLDGSFELSMLIPGDYVVIIKKPGFRGVKVDVSVNEGQESYIGEFSLIIDKILPNEPRQLTADAKMHVGLIKLSWLEPNLAEGEVEEDTELYRVYRSTNDDLNRTKVFFLGETSNTWFLDTFSEEYFGRTFYYLVEAIDGAGNVSIKASNIASATVVAPPIPQITAPKQRELVKDAAPLLKWQGGELVTDPDFIGYEIQLSPSIHFSLDKTTEVILDKVEEYVWGQQLEQGTWYWRIRARFNTDIRSSWSQTAEFVSASILNTANLVPYLNVMPNIIQNGASINYLLTEEAKVTILIYNLGGKLINKIVVGENQLPNDYTHYWIAKDQRGFELPNGLYFVQLIAESRSKGRVTKIRKVVVNR